MFHRDDTGRRALSLPPWQPSSSVAPPGGLLQQSEVRPPAPQPRGPLQAVTQRNGHQYCSSKSLRSFGQALFVEELESLQEKNQWQEPWFALFAATPMPSARFHLQAEPRTDH